MQCKTETFFELWYPKYLTAYTSSRPVALQPQSRTVEGGGSVLTKFRGFRIES